MADYNCTTRTNYFHVKDEEAFRNLMDQVSASAEIEVFTKTDTKDQIMFGFGCYGEINGLPVEDTDYIDFNAFARALQELVADDDAILIFEAGHEKLCYVTQIARIITPKVNMTMDLMHLAGAKAAELVGDEKWRTCCEY